MSERMSPIMSVLAENQKCSDPALIEVAEHFMHLKQKILLAWHRVRDTRLGCRCRGTWSRSVRIATRARLENSPGESSAGSICRAAARSCRSKMRGFKNFAAATTNSVPSDKGGLSVFPRLVASEHHLEYSEALNSTGGERAG